MCDAALRSCGSEDTERNHTGRVDSLGERFGDFKTAKCGSSSDSFFLSKKIKRETDRTKGIQDPKPSTIQTNRYKTNSLPRDKQIRLI